MYSVSKGCPYCICTHGNSCMACHRSCCSEKLLVSAGLRWHAIFHWTLPRYMWHIVNVGGKLLYCCEIQDKVFYDNPGRRDHKDYGLHDWTESSRKFPLVSSSSAWTRSVGPSIFTCCLLAGTYSCGVVTGLAYSLAACNTDLLTMLSTALVVLQLFSCMP
jgi:hypothetical protein